MPCPSQTNHKPSYTCIRPPTHDRAGDEHSLLRLCCDLYERTGKAWLFELETVVIILQYKWCVRAWVYADTYS